MAEQRRTTEADEGYDEYDDSWVITRDNALEIIAHELRCLRLLLADTLMTYDSDDGTTVASYLKTIAKKLG